MLIHSAIHIQSPTLVQHVVHMLSHRVVQRVIRSVEQHVERNVIAPISKIHSIGQFPSIYNSLRAGLTNP